jgi:hypothetical protein
MDPRSLSRARQEKATEDDFIGLVGQRVMILGTERTLFILVLTAPAGMPCRTTTSTTQGAWSTPRVNALGLAKTKDSTGPED